MNPLYMTPRKVQDPEGGGDKGSQNQGCPKHVFLNKKHQTYFFKNKRQKNKKLRFFVYS